MATSATTKNTRPDDQSDPDDRTRPNGQRADDATPQASDAAQVSDTARDATAAPTAALGQLLRQGQDDALRTARVWTGLLTMMNPVALLGARMADEPGDLEDRDDRPRGDAMFPARAFTDGAFEILGTALATQRRYVDEALSTQRRYVDQMLGTQRQLVGQALDAGATLAALTRAQHRRGPGL